MHHLTPPTALQRPVRHRRSLGLIGVGAFGEFILPHLTAHFDVAICDPGRDLSVLGDRHGVPSVDAAAAGARDIVVLAVPLRALEAVAVRIAPALRPGAIVVDVSSVKVRPLEILRRVLPAHAEIVATHPLFGPQSGRNGLASLSIAVCDGGPATRLARRFLALLGLRVIATDAERHDRQMAYVQGLTHLMARIVLNMNIPQVDHPTVTYTHLQHMVELVRRDSDELFETITAENPYAAEVLAEFWSGAERVALKR